MAPKTKSSTKNTISKYVVKKLFTCYKDEPVSVACKIMAKHNIGTIVIVDRTQKKKVLGIFTERDLVQDVIASDLSVTVPLEKVMTTNIVTAPHDANEAQISYLMNKNKVKKIVVLKNWKLYGIITQTDMITVLSDSWLK